MTVPGDQLQNIRDRSPEDSYSIQFCRDCCLALAYGFPWYWVCPAHHR